MAQNQGPGVIYADKFKDEDRNVVYFNIQTGGLYNKSDILQVGFRCGKKYFNTYIRPSRPIPAEVTRINGLSSVGRTLYKDGQEVETMSMSKAVKEILKYFEDLDDNPCILVAHQASFHVKRFKRILRICRKYYRFEDLVDGSVDTLSLFQNKFKRKGEDQNTLDGLSKSLLSFPILHDHNAEYSSFLIEQLVRRYVTYNELLDKLADW